MKKLLLAILMVLVLTSHALAETCTFDGSTDNTWGTAANWTCDGGAKVPVAGDAVVIPDGKTITIITGDVARIPATSGTLLSLTGAGSGTVVISTIGHPPGFALYATTIKGATAAYFLNITSNGADHVVDIVVGTGVGEGLIGSDSATTVGVYSAGAAGTINITGNITGGAVVSSAGLKTNTATTVNIRSSTIKGNVGTAVNNAAVTATVVLASDTGTGVNIDNSGAYLANIGYTPTWNPLTTNWIKWGTNYFSAGLASDSGGTAITAANTAAKIATGTYFVKKDDGVLTQGSAAGGGGGAWGF